MSEPQNVMMSSQIKTKQNDTSLISNLSDDKKSDSSEPDSVIVSYCKLCLVEKSKYTCPRCNIPYCSVACYQGEKHQSCSEAFYKECVLDELKETTNNQEDREKVLEMLMKDMEERSKDGDENVNDDDEEEDDPLCERIKDLDLDKDISHVWSKLNAKEREDFAKMLQDGRLSKLIELWVPWWHHKQNQKAIIDKSSSKLEMDSLIPEVLPDIPNIETLFKNAKPSSNCRFDLLNTLTVYSFVGRVYNGSHNECPVDSAKDFLEHCQALATSNSCCDVGEGIQTALNSIETNSKEFAKDRFFNVTLLRDVHKLVSGPGKTKSFSFMSAALSDTIRLLQKAYKVIKQEMRDKVKEQENIDELKALKQLLFKAEKKAIFLLAWLQRYGSAMAAILPLLQFEIETRESAVQESEELRGAVEEHMGQLKPGQATAASGDAKPNKPKIVELD